MILIVFFTGINLKTIIIVILKNKVLWFSYLNFDIRYIHITQDKAKFIKLLPLLIHKYC